MAMAANMKKFKEKNLWDEKSDKIFVLSIL